FGVNRNARYGPPRSDPSPAISPLSLIPWALVSTQPELLGINPLRSCARPPIHITARSMEMPLFGSGPSGDVQPTISPFLLIASASPSAPPSVPRSFTLFFVQATGRRLTGSSIHSNTRTGAGSDHPTT